MMVLTKACHSVAARALPTGQTATLRSCWRERPVSRIEAVSAAPAFSAMGQTASNNFSWLDFSSTSRWQPVSRAVSKVFLTVHGIPGEQAAGQSRDVAAAQDEAHRRIGRRTAQRQAKPAVQAIQVDLDERVNLAV